MYCGRLRRGVDGLSVQDGHLALQVLQVRGRDAVRVAVPYCNIGALACFEGSDLLLEEELRCGRGGVGAQSGMYVYALLGVEGMLTVQGFALRERALSINKNKQQLP
jgi:hypothetical protein